MRTSKVHPHISVCVAVLLLATTILVVLNATQLDLPVKQTVFKNSSCENNQFVFCLRGLIPHFPIRWPHKMTVCSFLSLPSFMSELLSGAWLPPCQTNKSTVVKLHDSVRYISDDLAKRKSFKHSNFLSYSISFLTTLLFPPIYLPFDFP